jgi:glycosyltransferase involved in cell wall biosynthesis
MFVIGTLNVGGSERHLTSVAPALLARGWRVSVFSLSGDGPLRDELERRGVVVLQSPVRRGQQRAGVPMRIAQFLLAAATLLFAMIRRRPVIVHYFLPAAYITGAPLAWLWRIPIRVMSRRSLNSYQGERGIFRFIERRLHPTMNAVLGNSLAVVRQLSAEGVSGERLGLIYNGVLESTDGKSISRVAERELLGLAATTLVLVIVANLIPYKGHADLIQALALANEHMPPDWCLLIVGRDDGIRRDLERQTEVVGLASRVLFLGSRRDVPALFAAADIGLLVSHEEGFSNAVIEGMAAGRPMIVTDVGGNAEAVRDGETGLVVPAHDAEQLARAIVRLSNDPHLRAEFGQAGRRRAQDHFSFSRCVDSYDRLYRGLLRGEFPDQIEGVAVQQAQN